MHNIYKRWQFKTIKDALKTRRVLVLVGPRQCGKTTLAMEIADEKTVFLSLDDLTLMESAKNDPKGFIQHDSNLIVIDEIQRVPELLQVIKQEVDNNQQFGRFILTGSANIQSLPNVRESLAGRSRSIRLRSLSQGELNGMKPNFLQKVFNNELSALSKIVKINKDSYLEKAIAGGYPEVLRFTKHTEQKRWHRDYLSALIERDLRDIINIRRHDSMFKLLEVLSAWSSKFIDISAIGSNMGLARPTIESYINALEMLYLVERVRPWHKTGYDRVSKKDKLFMTDTGIMSTILKWNLEKVRFDGALNGKLIETFVFNELSAIIDAQDDDYALYHYHDREKREIDFIVESPDEDLVGIEVKAGSAVNANSFKHLKWFESNIATNKKFTGIVLYTGENIARFGENLWAVPIGSLWAG